MATKVQFRMPSEEEIHRGALASYERASFTFINNWSPELLALSMPSIPIELSLDEQRALVSVANGDGIPHLSDLAARIDAVMAWRNYFVRLNTRSPKDCSHPSPPITCAGRQALMWIAGSMRTFDDLCMLIAAKKPAIIYLRDYVYIPEEWELRCFIKDGKLIAITQYHAKAANEVFQTSDGRDKAWADIDSFYRESVAPAVRELTFVLDVYPDAGGFRVLEINPYGSSDPILFGDYEAVERGGFKFVETPLEPATVQSGTAEHDTTEDFLYPESALPQRGRE